MHIDTLTYNKGWHAKSAQIEQKERANIVFLFGDSDTLKLTKAFHEIKVQYPQAHIVGASSSGNILGAEISGCPIVATAIQFDKSSIALSVVDFSPDDNIEELSQTLIQQLPSESLKHVFVISDGLNLNGSELIRGINKVNHGVPVTGGLAGDGNRFQETWVIANEPAKQCRIVAVGLYGDDLVTSTGCHAGWSPFGADRTVTKSKGNILYELDHKPALTLYKEYLGEYAKDLPLSGMRFPLSIREHDSTHEVIRTLLAIDEEKQSITFAGDIPEGYTARLMKPNLDALISGANTAAESIEILKEKKGLGLVVSCVGRRAVMQQTIEDELEAIEDTLGDNVQLTGFYSYGEFAPFTDDLLQCELHNQTVTLTVIYEK